ncbi:PEP-CTERM sorting domain-containing protein [Duganella aceris]|uniref:PEP-CTERM sorting domain-containing protein n=1 Tax=Duganella aceris TaxID=2703883 RepID=A0ABX0FND2_9BURK|nr:PEP-CTERM sorting domain-containing protein [Duganella aceris]NGZ86008.1 hypothetical protein [Duganella aceris]
MHLITSRLLKTLCGLAMLATFQARADTAYTADFSTAALDPGLAASMYKNGAWSPGVVMPWIVSTGSGYLLLAKTVSLPGQPFADGPHVQTQVGVTGDFVATVTADSSYNGAGGAGFFMDSAAGYTGISFGTSWLNDSAGDGYASNGFSAVSTALVTLQIKRVGDTLTKSYKLDGQSDFSLISSLTATTVPGWAIFDLTNYSDQPGAVMFNSFSVMPLAAVPEAETWAMLLLGLALVGARAQSSRRGDRK